MLLPPRGQDTSPGDWENLLDVIPFPIYVVAVETRDLVYVNKAMRDWTASVTSGKCHQVIHRLDKPCFFCRTPDLLAKVGDGESESLVYEFFNDLDDRWYQMQETLMTWFDGTRVKYCMAVDISATKEAQNALAEAHAELALKNRELESASRAKSDFLATMSHEIRTPMNGVLGMAQLVLDSPLPAEQRDQMETLKFSAEALLSILDDILDLSKLEAGRVEFETIPFELGAMFDGVATLMRSRASAKGLKLISRIDLGRPAWLAGDPARLRQVLLNLVGNAIKFTEAGGITMHARDTEGGVEISVTDTGIGIDDAARARLFQTFAQADTSISRRFGGTGLGLAICKRLIEGQGGEIGVDSTPGQGSRFWFRLPLARVAPPQATMASGPLKESQRPLSVLLAEDNPVNQKVAVGLLNRAGHRVTVAANGLEAVEAAKAGGFDLILMDMQMPVMDGLEAAGRIRALPGDAGRIPIIALTANAMQGDAERCLAAGMDGHVAKPIAAPVLFAVMREATGN